MGLFDFLFRVDHHFPAVFKDYIIDYKYINCSEDRIKCRKCGCIASPAYKNIQSIGNKTSTYYCPCCMELFDIHTIAITIPL